MWMSVCCHNDSICAGYFKVEQQTTFCEQTALLSPLLLRQLLQNNLNSGVNMQPEDLCYVM